MNQNPNAPASPAPPLQPLSPQPRKKSRWLLWGCGGLLLVLVVIAATVAITIWWIQRPIKPVVLTPKEKTFVEQKLKTIEAEAPVSAFAPSGSGGSSGAAGNPIAQAPAGKRERKEAASGAPRTYVPGGKVIRLTEREINGLLNENTDLGRSLRFAFERDAINAYLAVRLPADFPIGGGKMFRARGRFLLSLGSEGRPYAVLEDVTVLGLSLPKAWLGGIKGENLLEDAVGDGRGRLRGIKSLRVEPGALVLEVEE